ncbi:MAG: hypothetical protein R6X25_10005 [Candidatus Krumholzibacteriia bacterium]
MRLRADRFVTGLARVTAAAAGYQAVTDLAFTSEEASNIVAVETEHAHIYVHASGMRETSTIVFEARDRNGIPVDETHAVTMSFTQDSSGAVDATIHPATATTNQMGRAATTISAGDSSGVVEVSAEALGILSRPVRVAVHGGLPDREHFSIAFSTLNIAGLVYADQETRVVAHVGDLHGNPVSEHTAVFFSSEYGIVEGSARTDSLGRGSVVHYSAAPYPAIPGGDGLVLITARTVGWDPALARLDSLTTHGHVMWSGETILRVDSPANGFTAVGSIPFRFYVGDANGNPLTAGTTITVSTTRGDLSGDIAVELPDTQRSGLGYTEFTAVLSVGDDGPGPVTVTITVDSLNGDQTATRSGTLTLP